MTTNLGKRLTFPLIAALALLVVGVFATRAFACEPEGYVAELRVDGELPGGG
jgi:hypothetical protein